MDLHDRIIEARTLPAHNKPTLADDLFLHAGRNGWSNPVCDPDYELFTWPDTMDQTLIGEAAFGRFADDDMEIDDGV